MKIERREGYFISEAGFGSAPTELFYQTWTNSEATRCLVVTHGISEHSECYSKTAEALCELGWNIISWDLRGHGRSEGKRGYVERFEFYSVDLANLIQHLAKHGHLDRPFALVGHSMGGLVTLRYALDAAAANDSTEIQTAAPRAIALSSPLLGVALEVPKIKDLAARVLNRILPSFTLYNEIRFEDLTRDPAFLKTYGADPLRHDRIAPSLYLGMFESIDYVKSRAIDLQIPCLVLAAGQEKIVSLPATKEFVEQIGSQNKKLIVYEDSYHEIFNDLDRLTVFRDLDAFLKPLTETRT
jgi:alpha-beta hydrolase superfamily lysophospholipase